MCRPSAAHAPRDVSENPRSLGAKRRPHAAPVLPRGAKVQALDTHPEHEGCPRIVGLASTTRRLADPVSAPAGYGLSVNERMGPSFSQSPKFFGL